MERRSGPDVACAVALRCACRPLTGTRPLPRPQGSGSLAADSEACETLGPGPSARVGRLGSVGVATLRTAHKGDASARRRRSLPCAQPATTQWHARRSQTARHGSTPAAIRAQVDARRAASFMRWIVCTVPPEVDSIKHARSGAVGSLLDAVVRTSPVPDSEIRRGS
jgi:hypothetical protein